MNESEIIDLVRQAILVTLQVGAPVMLIGLVVGVSIALLQALTQVQEITLVFVPKIIAIFLSLFFFFPTMAAILMGFMQMLADRIVAGGGG
ncbi:MAG: flagellar biosynthetic protein FliQ [Alphaproteobacteria bacterium]|nr:flagellar biosynthetic protein FliQ [Alphaproteobacteria bacterium]